MQIRVSIERWLSAIRAAAAIALLKIVGEVQPMGAIAERSGDKCVSQLPVVVVHLAHDAACLAGRAIDGRPRCGSAGLARS